MRKDIFLPVLALAGGAVGFLLRLWQYASAYDPATELFAHGAPASLALVVWTVLMGALALPLGRGGHGGGEAGGVLSLPRHRLHDGDDRRRHVLSALRRSRRA